MTALFSLSCCTFKPIFFSISIIDRLGPCRRSHDLIYAWLRVVSIPRPLWRSWSAINPTIAPSCGSFLISFHPTCPVHGVFSIILACTGCMLCVRCFAKLAAWQFCRFHTTRYKGFLINHTSFVSLNALIIASHGHRSLAFLNSTISWQTRCT